MISNNVETTLIWNPALGRRDRAITLDKKVGRGSSFEDAVESLREQLDSPAKAKLTRKLKSLPYLAKNWDNDVHWAQLGETAEIEAFETLQRIGFVFYGTAWRMTLAKGILRLQRFVTTWSMGWALIIDIEAGVAPAKLGEVTREQLSDAVRLYETWADCLKLANPQN
jgi:hypothetical protein